ncbi:hypothetical protein RR46_11870 [Papilio xuthus]|uniref:Uncharacterized protein n=1 Tax=Papilio xuthus TaxID=66420 RepID=A0A194PN58_PAPXU|nr:hypothetical protein RR46_11870 [Papilio xuthus]
MYLPAAAREKPGAAEQRRRRAADGKCAFRMDEPTPWSAENARCTMPSSPIPPLHQVCFQRSSSCEVKDLQIIYKE